MDIILITGSIGTLFILMTIGFLIFRLGMINRHGVTGLTSLLVNVTLPCLIITSMQIPITPDLVSDMVTIFSIQGVLYLISFACALMIPRFLQGTSYEHGVFRFMLFFSNLGFMGYPICEALFGPGSLFYVSLVNLPFGFLVFTVGVLMLRPDIGKELNLKKIINPGFLASICGLILFLCNIRIPSPLSDAFMLLGSTTSPLAMVVIGALLATLPLSTMIGDYRIYLISAFRLIGIPLALFLIISRIIQDPLIIGVTVILAAMPVAANTVLLAEEYHVDSELASKGVFISTLICIVTVPLIGMILL